MHGTYDFFQKMELASCVCICVCSCLSPSKCLLIPFTACPPHGTDPHPRLSAWRGDSAGIQHLPPGGVMGPSLVLMRGWMEPSHWPPLLTMTPNTQPNRKALLASLALGGQTRATASGHLPPRLGSPGQRAWCKWDRVSWHRSSSTHNCVVSRKKPPCASLVDSAASPLSQRF